MAGEANGWDYRACFTTQPFTEDAYAR